MSWNAETQSYSGEPLTSTGNFGPFESVYTLSSVIPGVGPISFEVTGMFGQRGRAESGGGGARRKGIVFNFTFLLDTKNVGYGIVVSPKATIELSGRYIPSFFLSLFSPPHLPLLSSPPRLLSPIVPPSYLPPLSGFSFVTSN